jgi:hypothetical protein
VALSFDDGSDFDVHDMPHPRWGPQRSMFNILRDFRAQHGAAAQPGLHATSFSIVSPSAREELDRTCMIGTRWWNDDWWREAEASGLMAIESHGWDHNHETLARPPLSIPTGTFDVTSAEDARFEIDQASAALTRLRGRGGDVLFAYPFGPASDFLVREYFPNTSGHCVRAAFATGGRPVTPETSRWAIPRYVFRQHWRSSRELRALLGAVRARKDESPQPAQQSSWRSCPPGKSTMPGTWRATFSSARSATTSRTTRDTSSWSTPRRRVKAMPSRAWWLTSTRAPTRRSTCAAACAWTSARIAACRAGSSSR